MDPIQQAAQILKDHSHAIALTGAGISVDSGIPDFRSAQGLWARYDPMEYATLSAFRKHPEKVWRMLHEMEELVVGAEPNAGHRALAELEELGVLTGVVTQNIDGLHQAAGSSRVVEFHGGADRLVCFCGYTVAAADAPQDPVPCCPQCGGVLKPDIVFFGEPIPSDALRRAFLLASEAQVVLVVGTSATVSPAAEVPVLARQSGAQLIEFNVERTALSDLCDVCVTGRAARTLPAVVEALRAR